MDKYIFVFVNYISFCDIPLHVFCLYSNWIVWFLLLSFDEFFMFSRYDSFGRNMCCSLLFHSLTGSFIEQRTYILWSWNYLFKFTLWIILLVSFLHQAQGPEYFLLRYLYLVLNFTFNSMVNFELIFIYGTRIRTRLIFFP